ncbi:MAG: hypothetical protein HY907_22900 [Deltaproteobacteria bacterium]|nr:hypothetical protein [Deltaproteobacteria bacterium]
MVVAAGLLAAPAGAAAFSLDFRAQGQVAVLAGMSLPGPGFGSVEVQINGSIWSIGAALGVAYQRYPSPDGDMLDGGVFHAAFQWRFVALISEEVYLWFDPHLDLGMELGGARGASGSWFKGEGYGGLSLDFAVFPPPDGDPHVVLTVQYRWTPPGVHAPDSAPDHLMLFGLGYRGAG